MNECICSFLVSAIYPVCQDQFGVGAKCCPCPNIAEPENSTALLGDIVRFGIYKAPCFVALNATAFHIANGFIVKALARRAELAQKPKHCFLVGSGQA